ncbi:hypothetical protein BKA63DRAFT_568715 [Paraphoma chrysanthemicola]|nr:hypothetical protein BKA63DRAFT_568715 [Paraphoma chrysanthemicola]
MVSANAKPGFAIAHGILMSLVVLIWFPLGVFLLRLLKIKHTVRWHALWQSIGLAVLLSGTGFGALLSQKSNQSSESHVLLGAVIVVLFLLMPVIGWLHHKHFAATGKKDFKSPLHVWGGRILLLLALANGITGLQLSKEKKSVYIVYGVIAGVCVVVYAGMLWLRKHALATNVEELETEMQESRQRA